MAELSPTDIFKFVAIRPPQLTTAADSGRGFIRDVRARNPDGVQQLVVLARDLSNREAALARWNKLDLDLLRSTADAYVALVTEYQSVDARVSAPDGNEMAKTAGAIRFMDLRDPQAQTLGWNTLYIAESTGPDAGPRLEMAMAALRLLHFGALLKTQAHQTKEAALTALLAVPAIPIQFKDAVSGPPSSDPTAQPVFPTSSDANRTQQILDFSRELSTTDRLLKSLQAVPAVTEPPIHTVASLRKSEFTQTQFSISTVPTLIDAIKGNMSRDQVELLNRLQLKQETPVPMAKQALQNHLSTLNEQAAVLSGDVAFHQAMQQLRGIKIPATAPTARAGTNITGVVGLDDPGTAPNINVGGRITPLGIGDLKVVKQTLLAYVPGEVAHIENVLKGESKQTKHRNLDRTETTVFTSEEDTTSNERDTQSTDRSELKREAELVIKDDLSVKAGITVTAAYGPVVTTASGDFAYATSKQDSQKSSSNFAQEIVDRSVSKIETKTTTQRTSKTISETEDVANHAVENTKGTEHVIGVYRWVDKRYRAQVYNYGVRLLLEFILPEPSAFYRAAQLSPAQPVTDAIPPQEFLNFEGAPLSIPDMNIGSYQTYASRYNATDVKPPPPDQISISTTMVKDGLEIGKSIGISSDKFIIPEGYQLASWSAAIAVVWKNRPKFTLQVLDQAVQLLNIEPGVEEAASSTNSVESSSGPIAVLSTDGSAVSIPVSVAAYDVLSFAVNLQADCVPTPSSIERWRIETFGKIATAYQSLRSAYDQKNAQARAAAAGISADGRNPEINRITERTELRKLCITMMTGQHFAEFNAMTDPADKPVHHPELDILKALGDGPIIQFFEQAFEWEQMTYLFYPYFWGRKRNWLEVSHYTHGTDPDPLFDQFLTAGAVRVMVPVPVNYIPAVEYLLQSTKPELGQRIWLGGPRPTLDSDLYISIADETRDQTDDLAGATPEGTPWEFTVPTTLVWLQKDGTLPVFAA